MIGQQLGLERFDKKNKKGRMMEGRIISTNNQHTTTLPFIILPTIILPSFTLLTVRTTMRLE